jgi:chromosomal replication initiation ATPase DnaA
MQDIKCSLLKEKHSQFISPFQINNRQFSFHLNNTMTDNTLNLNNSQIINRPMTGNSNKSTNINPRKSSDITRPGTGKTTRTNKTNVTKNSNVNTSHDYSLLNFKGKQTLEGCKYNGGTACAEEIIDAIDVTSYKFSKARPQSTASIRKFVQK